MSLVGAAATRVSVGPVVRHPIARPKRAVDVGEVKPDAVKLVLPFTPRAAEDGNFEPVVPSTPCAVGAGEFNLIVPAAQRAAEDL